MSLSDLKIVEIEQRITWPCKLSEEFKHALLSKGLIQTREQGFYYSSTDLTKDGLFFILKGSLILSIRTSDFDHFTYKLLGTNDWLYYGELMDYRLQESISADFLEEVEILKVPEKQISLLEKVYPEMYKLMFAILKQKTLPLIQKGILNQKFSIPIKVAFTLLDVATKQVDINGVQPMLTITQQQLANLADVTRPRVNAVLKTFQTDGLVDIVRGKIYLKDVHGINTLLKTANLTFYSPGSNKTNQ